MRELYCVAEEGPKETMDTIAEADTTINDLCRRYSVLRLELFGSAATGDYKDRQQRPRLSG